MKRILFYFFCISLYQINCRAENIINADLIGFSDDGNFVAVYTYYSASESYLWNGKLAVLDVKSNKSVDSLALEKEYHDSISSRFIVNDLLKRMLTGNTSFLNTYGVVKGNLGYLSYYQSINSYLLQNHDCVTNPELIKSQNIPVSSQRFTTTSTVTSRQLNLGFVTTIFDEADEAVDCSDCSKKFGLKIIDEESGKLVFDFQNQSSHGDCYRDYFVGSIYFYGTNKMVILVYGLQPGFEGLMLTPIFISTVLPDKF